PNHARKPLVIVDGLRCARSASSCAASAALMGPTTGWLAGTAAGVGRFDSLMIVLSCAREGPKAANRRYEAVDAGACCDHARPVIEDDGITPVTGAKHELSAVLRLCAEDGLARAAESARREVQVYPGREQELELHVEIAADKVANESPFALGIVLR